MTRAELRAFAMAELEGTLDIIGAEIEALTPLLLRPEPPATAMAQYRQLGAAIRWPEGKIPSGKG